MDIVLEKVEESKKDVLYRLLGFVMINTYMQKCSSGHSIAEFMILPKFRNRKIG